MVSLPVWVRIQGRAPGCQGAKPPEADEVLGFKTLIFNASAIVLLPV